MTTCLRLLVGLESQLEHLRPEIIRLPENHFRLDSRS